MENDFVIVAKARLVDSKMIYKLQSPIYTEVESVACR